MKLMLNIQSTRSPIDGNRLISNDAALLVPLLLLVLSLSVVVLISDSDSADLIDASSLAICGIPLYSPCCGAASGTIRLNNSLAQPHGKIL